ncbi:hypothetical protein ACHAXN_001931 [Cyclotella atomus]
MMKDQATECSGSTDDAAPHDASSTTEQTETMSAPNKETLAAIQTQLDALESMRRANLDVEFSSSSIKVDHGRCTHCQREELKASRLKAEFPTHAARCANSDGAASGGMGAKLRELKIDGHRIRSLDGRRIRNFSKRFLSKSTTALGNADTAADGRAQAVSETIAESSFTAEINGGEISKVDAETKSAVLHNNHLEIADKDTNDVNDADATAKLHLAESCPARLEDQSSSLLSESATMTSTTTMSSTNTLRETKSKRNLLKRTPSTCLTCGHPTCHKHISNTFSNHIQICHQCAYLFELEFLVDVIAQATEEVEAAADQDSNDNKANHHKSSNNNTQSSCQHKINSMIDCYDRAKLLLTYTAQYAPDIASNLQSRTAKSNKIGVGANASGIVSGITGIVGAGALLCPPVAAAGVPILIASLIFGGTATAAHTGDYVGVKYWSEPNVLADKMVVLHGMCLSLLRVVEVLSYGLKLKSSSSSGSSTENLDQEEDVNETKVLKDEKKYADGADNDNTVTQDTDNDDNYSITDKRQALTNDIQSLLEKHGVNTTLGKQSISSATAISGSNVANRQTRFFGRITTTAAASFRFVPLAGGVLSAASLVVEANEIKATLSRMNEGNPCEKSERVLEIASEVERLPDAALIADECARVFREAEEERRVVEEVRS